MIENHDSSNREQSGVRKALLDQNLNEVFNEAALTNLRPLVAGITLIYAAFSAVNLTGKVLPGYAFSIILTMDLTMLSVSVVLLLLLNRGIVPARISHLVGACLAILLIANVLVTLVVLKVPFHTTYLVLICVGAGCFMLSRVWLALVFCVCGASWLVVSRHFSSAPEIIYFALALFAGAVLSVVIQRSRREAVISVFELRHSDALSREHLARELHNSQFRYQQMVETAFEGIGITDQNRLKAIIAELPEAVLVLDDQRRIRSLNPPAEVHMKMLAECGIDDVLTEFGGYSLEDLLSAGDKKSWKTLTIDDDPPKHFEAVARRLVDAGADGYIVVSRDVTQKKLDQEQIQAQQRIAAVGQLAAGIAHDFNNILQSMLMSGEMLKLNKGLGEVGNEHVDLIIRQTGRASTLVRQILDFSRKSVRTGRPLNLSQSIAETVQLLKRTISERVELSFEVINDAWDAVITGDAAQLQQLVTNFVINAQDAMPQGGKVCIRLESLEFGKNDDRPFPSMPSGKWLVLTVADEGCGIPSKLQSRVYEPFFTTKRPGKGTGLGLAQAYGIVKQHEGFIDLVSSPDEGTTFSVFLPFSMDEEIQELPEPKKLDLRGNGEVVVVIEDQASLLKIIKVTLESFGFEVYAMSDADEAVAECQRLGAAVDVVLSDVVMPRRSGPEVFRTIRGKCRNAGFILMSGYPLSEHPDEVTNIENVEWLQKPFEISTLVEVVSKAARS